MKNIYCIKCGQPPAFPQFVKEPWTCIECKTTAEHEAKRNERRKGGWIQGCVSWLRGIGHWLKEEESWSVIYPDGQRSRRMKRRDARAYKAIFGGTLVFNPRKPANADISDRC